MSILIMADTILEVTFKNNVFDADLFSINGALKGVVEI